MECALAVLRSEELLRVITCYQDGLYGDMGPLVNELRWPNDFFTRMDLETTLPDLISYYHWILDPWIAKHRSGPGLGLVLNTLRKDTLCSVLVMEAVLYSRLDILHEIHRTAVNEDRPDQFTGWALHYAILSNNLAVVECLWAKTYYVCREETRLHVIHQGNLHLLEWLHAHDPCGYTCSVQDMDVAALCGHLHIVQWLHEYHTEGCTKAAMNLAARNGHLHIIQWLHEHRNEGCTVHAMDWAAWRGHLHVVKWLHEHRREGCSVNALVLAHEAHQTDIVEWLLMHRRSDVLQPNAMVQAARRGNLALIQWLHLQIPEGWSTRIMDEAAMGGHLELVRWLHANRSEGCTTSAMDTALDRGHWTVVQWLHLNRREGCSSKALERAVQVANLDVLEWLHHHAKYVWSTEKRSQSHRTVESSRFRCIDIKCKLTLFKLVQIVWLKRRP
ncbi:hypothetical protein AeMF1_013314 [Aphanomyces euteiches]|nr:hypothetical protein AeMF1_013314 [Aphanomyces euteiches]